MSKVKIQGSASGSAVYTLTTGSTSTDRTITLPDGTGTLLTTDGDGSSLTGAGPTHTSAGSAPVSPAIGDFWHDTTNEKLYIRTNDGTSDVWMQI